MSDGLRDTALVIGAKEPVPGTVKTRLGVAIGHERAATLYCAFLRDLAARFRPTASYDVLWACAPTTNWLPALAGENARAFAQEGADWTARQRHIFRWTAARGYRRTVLIASDSPHLARGVVVAAFHALDDAAAALAPTVDGGYSLIGQRWGVDILGDVPMSTTHVLRDLLANARQRGQVVATLPATWDVDELTDLARLAQYLDGSHDAPATADAFRSLGLAGWLLAPAHAATGGT